MRKEDIIEILLSVRDRYENAIAKPVEDRITYLRSVASGSMIDGMCSAVKAELGAMGGFGQIYDELIKECPSEKVNSGYWYRTPFSMACLDLDIIYIKSEALQLRFDHLDRTITRLQNEINNNYKL